MNHSRDSRSQKKPVAWVSRYSRLSAAVVFAMGCTKAAWAVDDDYSTRLLRTSFASPGARAAGMGGAFIGLADDSSAAFLNPAGIVLLPAVELTVEARYRDTDFDFQAPNGTSIDNDSSINLSYLSLVVPYERWGFGVFYGSLGDSATEFDVEDGAYGNPGAPASPTNPRTFPFVAGLDLEDRYYGAGFGFKASDNFRLGASLYLADRDLRAGTVVAGGVELTPGAVVQSFNGQFNRVSDEDFGYNLGLHWANTQNTWSAGLSYRSKLEFDREVSVNVRERSGTTAGPEILSAEGVGSSIIPSALTLGLGWKPNSDWVIALDISHVQFSDILDEDRPGGVFLGVPLAVGSNFGVADYLDINDAIEVRLGAEYSFERSGSVWSLRGGVWREADGTLHFDSGAFLRDNNGQEPISNLFRQYFPRFGGVTHGSIGLGVVTGSFAVDFAVDHSERDTEVVVSAGYSWE